jgi:hypothetical protein
LSDCLNHMLNLRRALLVKANIGEFVRGAEGTRRRAYRFFSVAFTVFTATGLIPAAQPTLAGPFQRLMAPRHFSITKLIN